jgi:hypothetical protein
MRSEGALNMQIGFFSISFASGVMLEAMLVEPTLFAPAHPALSSQTTALMNAESRGLAASPDL